jgi:hypothetical protein
MFIKPKVSIHIVIAICIGMTTCVYGATPVSTPSALTKAQLQLVGRAQFSVLFWDIYESRLYTPSGQFEGVKPSVLFEITYQKDITKQDLIERTIEQWQHLGLVKDDYQRFVLPLNNLWPNIIDGDRLALHVGVGESVFYLNDKYIGQIEGEGFAALFLDIWLSPKTSQPKLRLQLLGDKKGGEK